MMKWPVPIQAPCNDSGSWTAREKLHRATTTGPSKDGSRPGHCLCTVLCEDGEAGTDKKATHAALLGEGEGVVRRMIKDIGNMWVTRGEPRWFRDTSLTGTRTLVRIITTSWSVFPMVTLPVHHRIQSHTISTRVRCNEGLRLPYIYTNQGFYPVLIGLY